MAKFEFGYPPGATPLDPDEAKGLIPSHLSTQAQLNEWEFRNVAAAEAWAFGGARKKDLLSLRFMKRLHKHMFGDTWRWAGRFRLTEKNVGIDPAQVAPELAKLCADVEAQVEHRAWPNGEIAARFHHRLTAIHPFPNGNGRFSRMMADLLLVKLGEPRFEWGAGTGKPDEVRRRYIAALRAADGQDVAPLLEFLGVQR